MEPEVLMLASFLGHLASLRMSRSDEKEADLLGMRLRSRCGVRSQGGVDLATKGLNVRNEDAIGLAIKPSTIG